MNVVLANTEERVFTSEGIDKQQLGLYLIRGDNVAIVGKIHDTTPTKTRLTDNSRRC